MSHCPDKTTIRKGGAVLLFLILLSGLFTTGLTAAGYTVNTIPNVRLGNRYNYVSNPDEIISSTDEARINSLLRMLEDSTSIEVAVVAVESIGDNDARAFATDLFKQWGIGKREDDNGLLIQLVTEPAQRSVVFETGYGLEGVLPDAICYRLQQQYMIPDMRDGNYSTGMVKGVEAVVGYLLASDYERVAIIGNNSLIDDNELFSTMLLLLIFGVPIGIALLALFAQSFKHRKKKCPRCGQKTFRFDRTVTLKAATNRSAGTEEDIYICSNCGYTEKKSRIINALRSGSGGPIIFGGSGGFGGGRTGGGGSFGGGRSGGGGSISRF